MTKDEAIKWLENLKSDIGKMQFRALWDYGQAIDEIIDLLSAETVGVGKYENAMQKLREMPRYLNGIKVKQIKKIQSDVVEVVRCEKCKHYSVEGFTTLFGWCNAKEHPTDEDDFCKYGKRREK